MKVRDLRIAKSYRDAVKKWGEPNVQRKRTIIAPLMSEAKTKDVNIEPMKYKGEENKECKPFALVQDLDFLLKQIKIDGTFGRLVNFSLIHTVDCLNLSSKLKLKTFVQYQLIIGKIYILFTCY